MLVHYFFYKNVACFGGQLFLQFINNFSIQTLYDSFNLTFYNIFWTSLPIFLYGLWHTAAIFYSWYFYFHYGLNITSKDELGQ